MTVFVYINTSKQVGDPEHIKVFANADAAENGSRKTTRKALLSNMRFLNEPHRPLDRRQLKYGPRGKAGAASKEYASVPINKLGSAHPLDSKWQITWYLLYWVSNRIFWGAPSVARQLEPAGFDFVDNQTRRHKACFHKDVER